MSEITWSLTSGQYIFAKLVDLVNVSIAFRVARQNCRIVFAETEISSHFLEFWHFTKRKYIHWGKHTTDKRKCVTRKGLLLVVIYDSELKSLYSIVSLEDNLKWWKANQSQCGWNEKEFYDCKHHHCADLGPRRIQGHCWVPQGDNKAKRSAAVSNLFGQEGISLGTRSGQRRGRDGRLKGPFVI